MCFIDFNFGEKENTDIRWVLVWHKTTVSSGVRRTIVTKQNYEIPGVYRTFFAFITPTEWRTDRSGTG